MYLCGSCTDCMLCYYVTDLTNALVAESEITPTPIASSKHFQKCGDDHNSKE